jgi:hypothetical protein
MSTAAHTRWRALRVVDSRVATRRWVRGAPTMRASASFIDSSPLDASSTRSPAVVDTRHLLQPTHNASNTHRSYFYTLIVAAARRPSAVDRAAHRQCRRQSRRRSSTRCRSTLTSLLCAHHDHRNVKVLVALGPTLRFGSLLLFIVERRCSALAGQIRNFRFSFVRRQTLCFQPLISFFLVQRMKYYVLKSRNSMERIGKRLRWLWKAKLTFNVSQPTTCR